MYVVEVSIECERILLACVFASTSQSHRFVLLARRRATLTSSVDMASYEDKQEAPPFRNPRALLAHVHMPPIIHTHRHRRGARATSKQRQRWGASASGGTHARTSGPERAFCVPDPRNRPKAQRVRIEEASLLVLPAACLLRPGYVGWWISRWKLPREARRLDLCAVNGSMIGRVEGVLGGIGTRWRPGL